MLKDRGTIKWTSLMLPEHVELLKQLWKETEKVSKPIIDPQMIDVFRREIYEAYIQKNEITIRYYEDGYFKEETGYISSFNQRKKMVQFENGENISLRQIVSIL